MDPVVAPINKGFLDFLTGRIKDFIEPKEYSEEYMCSTVYDVFRVLKTDQERNYVENKIKELKHPLPLKTWKECVFCQQNQSTDLKCKLISFAWLHHSHKIDKLRNGYAGIQIEESKVTAKIFDPCVQHIINLDLTDLSSEKVQSVMGTFPCFKFGCNWGLDEEAQNITESCDV